MTNMGAVRVRRHSSSEDAEEESRRKAVKSIREMAGRHLPHRPSDADEEVDPVERADREPMVARAEAEVSQCLGAACPMPSSTCDGCRLNSENGEKEEKEGNVPREEEENKKSASQEQEHQRVLHLKRLSSSIGSPQEGRRDLFMTATSSRGEHLGLELRFYGRIKI